ncbi:hypothetical protein HOK51_00640 [Candidatus Woesearchaeota archaeon]|jgi:hypothetical protein|nr:hypothetical protein [Candidatus Woesearchaeota archaeon]MBT6518321.1 hypothetical protein [Candidatus Woesearchaeota archaeon]MBT7366618.1 hypothetical protein [Candidatus Woesearchaeota archaeon]
MSYETNLGINFGMRMSSVKVETPEGDVKYTACIAGCEPRQSDEGMVLSGMVLFAISHELKGVKNIATDAGLYGFFEKHVKGDQVFGSMEQIAIDRMDLVDSDGNLTDYKSRAIEKLNYVDANLVTFLYKQLDSDLETDHASALETLSRLEAQ